MATADRLRQYLSELKPNARALLIKELERSLVRGDADPIADLVLHELRVLARESREGGPRQGTAPRLFFKPLEPFLVDDTPQHKHPYRIARAVLEPLWTWIRRDLVAAEAKIYIEQAATLSAAGDIGKAEYLARAFQDKVAVALSVALEDAERDDKARRRLIAQIGTPRAHDDATILCRGLKFRDMLGTLAGHLPGHIGNFTGEALDQALTLIDVVAKRERDAFPYTLLVVMQRLAAPWQLIRLATQAAGSDQAARVADSGYAIAVDIALAEVGRMVAELRADLRGGQGIANGALLKSIHDSARGLRTEIELSHDSIWGRELAALRAQISELLKAEIESMPGRVRRLLRPRGSHDIKPNSQLDPGEVAETELLIEFVGVCRHFAPELALNEMTQRAYSDLQQYLDSGSGALLDGLRHAGAADEPFRASQVEALIRFCRKVFGADYAAMLSKAAEVAITSAAPAAARL
ncbi:MAG: hypothetical protein JO245_02855 [Pseudolabrys sp.]|nr:hypothetical protein [Pseudolabrys sp.]